VENLVKLNDVCFFKQVKGSNFKGRQVDDVVFELCGIAIVVNHF
jgi:hypothetical protein